VLFVVSSMSACLWVYGGLYRLCEFGGGEGGAGSGRGGLVKAKNL
jgi:hypothetical protein